MSDKLGSFITVDVDPESNDGLEQGTALVTGAYDDGSLRVRVFGADAAHDVVRNHVGDDGQPFEYPDAEQQQSAAAPAQDQSAELAAAQARIRELEAAQQAAPAPRPPQPSA